MRGERSSIPANDEAPTGALIREALHEMREVVRLEVALARDEVKGDLVRAKTGAALLALAGAAALSGLALLLVAVALTFAVPWTAALVIGAGLMAVAAASGVVAWRSLPRKPLAETTGRLATDARQLKEHVG